MSEAHRRSASERTVLTWMCVVIAVNQLGFGAMIPTLPLYARSFGVSHSAIGSAIAVYGLARFLWAVPTGQLSDRLGRRPTLALGGLTSALGNLWCALATSFPEFLLARFVAGGGAALVLTTGAVILADISRPERRGRTMAIYQGVFLFAVGIGPYPGGLLGEHLGLGAPFYAYAAAGALVGAIAWFSVPETRHWEHPGQPTPRAENPPLAAQIRLLTAQIGFLLVGAIGFMHAVVRTGGIFSIIPVLGRDQLALSASAIGLSLAIGSVVGLAATYPAGVLVDRYGRKTVIVPATLLTGLSLILFCLAPGYACFVAASIAWGAASAIGGAAPAAYAADSAPPGMNAAAMSTYRMLGDSGYVIGPLALGFTVDALGADVTLVIAAALIVLIGLLFARFAPETFRGR